MPRAFWPTARRVGAALGLALSLVIPASPASGQTTIFNSNGFEAPSYSTAGTGNIFGQQGFTFVPSNTAGVIQNTTVRNGTQAFQVIGPNMIAPGYNEFNPLTGQTVYTGANYWYRNNFNYNPIASATPFVQVQFAGLRTATGFFDMPFAGVYMEGLNATGAQQGLLTLIIGSDGRLAAMTSFSSTVGGSTGTVSTATGLFGADTWHGLFAELNFATQTYRVYREGDPNPIQFQTAVGALITDIPFRNGTTGLSTTVSVKEIGMLAFNFKPSSTPGDEMAPTNNFFIDDYLVTASATTLAPVPEPGLILAVGAAGVAGWRVYRRRRAAAA